MEGNDGICDRQDLTHVLATDSHEVEDDLRREHFGEIMDEVDLGTTGQGIKIGVDNLLYLGSHQLHGRRRERLGDDPANSGVLLAVHVQDRAVPHIECHARTVRPYTVAAA